MLWNDWWEIARQSVYYEEILRRMMQPVQHRIPSLLDMRDTIFRRVAEEEIFLKYICQTSALGIGFISSYYICKQKRMEDTVCGNMEERK